MGVIRFEGSVFASNETVRRAGTADASGFQMVAHDDSIQSAECGGLAVEGVAQTEGIVVVTRAGGAGVGFPGEPIEGLGSEGKVEGPVGAPR